MKSDMSQVEDDEDEYEDEGDDEDDDEDEDEDAGNGNAKAKKVIKKKGLQFTLTRKGYDALPFFPGGTNDYEFVSYKFLDDYTGVIEPHASMVLTLDENGEKRLKKGYTYKYTVCPYDEETGKSVGKKSGECESGFTKKNGDKKYFSFACSAFDEYAISVVEYSAAGKATRKASEKAVCMYVRRELRSLTSSDLSKTMDAMYTLWSTSEEDGQSKYGDNFHSAKYFSEAHNFNAAQRDADHIHEGVGFLTQHVKLTNIFEASMQSVDPSVSLFYWDFTIENENGLSLTESPMFTADTFGSVNLATEPDNGFQYSKDNILDAAIPDGRWKLAKVDLNDKYDTLGNGFGYMRSPWNTNYSPYISRFPTSDSTLPSCKSYYNWLELDDIVDFMSKSPFGPHGSVHGNVGGIFGCDLFDPLISKGLLKSSSKSQICTNWGFTMKELYRINYINRKDSSKCSASKPYDYDSADCGFNCNDEYFDKIPNALNGLIKRYLKEDLTDDEQIEWRNFLCKGDGWRIFVGDHLESASPSDPSFWPVHPTLERALQAKLMAGGFGDYTWPSDAKDACDKSSCYDDTDKTRGSYEHCCYGHYENDQLMDFESGDTEKGIGPTNAEIMKWTDPRKSSYAVPYIYDDFTWSHCSGSDITGLLSEQFRN